MVVTGRAFASKYIRMCVCGGGEKGVGELGMANGMNERKNSLT